MSTITRERIAELANFKPSGANSVNSATREEWQELARIALASLEAEPVAWTDADELRDARNGGTGYLFALCGDANKFADPRRQLMLYTAAPAPLVSDEIAVALITAIEKEQDRLFGQDYLMDSKDCIDVIRKEMERLNACRAAMLQGAHGNPPVIPDGWKLVPVEPTKEMIINGFESEPDESFSDEKEWEAYDAMSGCQQAAHRAKLCYAAMIAAAPKP